MSMTSSVDQPVTHASIRLLLFVTSRPATLDLAEQIRHHFSQLPGDYPAYLEIVEIGHRPYMAEHYKLVATPALVKTYPPPAQVLVGEDLTTQLEVWWSRWQRQVALVINQPETERPELTPQSSSALLQLSEELFELRQERTQLLDQLRFKDRIIALLVHDLRSPLTATALAIETLQQQYFQDQQSHCKDQTLTDQLLEHARFQIRKMDAMITDILEAARGTAAELSIRASEVQLINLCHSVIEDFQPRIQDKQLTLDTDLPADLPTVHADADKIRQVLFNLLDNAIKYTPAQGHIWVTALHRTTQKIQVTVSDTGPGIAAEDQELIFTDSVRLVRDQHQDGYGIGLSLCRRIIRSHYGQIWVNSTLGEGSRFHFTLPVYRA